MNLFTFFIVEEIEDQTKLFANFDDQLLKSISLEEKNLICLISSFHVYLQDICIRFYRCVELNNRAGRYSERENSAL